jgi:hypothetical protein
MLEVLDRFQRILIQRKEGMKWREERNNRRKARNRYHIEVEQVDGSRMEMELKPCWPEKEKRKK